MNSVVRVAVNNNFNCTKAEWAQLDTFATQNPNKSFFINSNINTPDLSTITNHPYKAVVTVNPNIKVKEISKLIARLAPIKDQLAFVRLKYIPNEESFSDLLAILLAVRIPVVITLQRFNSLKSIAQFTNPKYYAYSCGRFRLIKTEQDKIISVVAKLQKLHNRVWICDQSGLGCQGCGLCSKLTTGKSLKIESLNLSTSGICPYNCPDCYAKTMQNFCKKMGYKEIVYDIIKQNEKQSGKTAHIKEAKNARA